MSSYPPRRCHVCRNEIEVDRSGSEPKWVHKNGNTDHAIDRPLKLAEHQDDEK